MDETQDQGSVSTGSASQTAAWNEARPKVNEALTAIGRHSEWIKATYRKGPEHRDEVLAQLAEFELYVRAVAEVLPAPDDGAAR